MNPITFNFTGAIQNYTVPVSGTYDLSGFGAGGGNGPGGVGAGGSGAQIGATFDLTAGQQLQIIVGGVGGNSAVGSTDGAGGGGFTEVLVNSGANGAYVPLFIAGGGGGASGSGIAGGNASVTNPGTLGAGGNLGGGAAGIAGNVVVVAGLGGGGGAGATSNGLNAGNILSVTGGQGGMSAANGAAGGAVQTAGGFGGGGGGGGAVGTGSGGGGGGGGSSGGIGGTGDLDANSTGGKGGTSYISNTGVQNFQETMAGNGVSRLNGSVRISAPAPPAQPANPAPCYVTGTRIRVLRGRTVQDVPVERLRVGDLAISAAGKPRPIRWIGNRSYPGLSAPHADRPVHIRADALSPGVPARDLLVSPDHALFLDGLFVAAGHLINGETITRGETVADLTYWHVELDSHDLLMAENTPAESFLAAPGVRGQFDGTAAPDAASAPVPYAMRVERGPELDALRSRLILRAGLRLEAVPLGAMRSWLDLCDGIRVAGWARDVAFPEGPVCLDIVVDGEVVAMTLAEEYRADIEAAGVGTGRHGFDLDLDEPLAPGMMHIVEVRRSADHVSIGILEVDATGRWGRRLAA